MASDPLCAVIPQDHRRQVVALCRADAELTNRAEEAIQESRRRQVAMDFHAALKSFLTELSSFAAKRFSHAVAKHHERVAWIKLYRLFFECGLRERAKDEAASIQSPHAAPPNQ